MDLLKKLRCKFSLLLLFCFCFLLNGHNADIQSLHKISGCETKQRGPVGLLSKQLCGSFVNPIPASDRSSCVRLFPLLSFFKEKNVDPNDFSPCIKQKTIITVEFIFF